MMKRGNEENNHKTSSPPPTQRLRCREISTGEKSDDINIPFDLTVEILKKLPTKSILRFQCVSKQWSSTIGSCRHFIDSIVTRSWTHPPTRDTQIIHHNQDYPKHNFFIFSSTYPKNTDKESGSTTAASYQHIRGLICCWSDCPNSLAIYNPTTRQYFALPVTHLYYIVFCLFGYDPLKNQYKVMCLPRYDMKEQACQVFTLGDDHTWRNIQGIGFHLHFSPPICINGVTYYRANKENRGSNYFLVSFDVSSEKLSPLEAPKTLIDHWCTLIKYQGKLGFICCQKGVEIWVMEDSGKKQEWSKIIFYDMEGFEKWHIGGVTHGGEQGRRHITKGWGSCPG